MIFFYLHNLNLSLPQLAGSGDARNGFSEAVGPAGAFFYFMEAKMTGYRLEFAGLHLKDSLLDDITIEELRDTVSANIPADKINFESVKKEFESLLRMKVDDAENIASRVIPEIVKDIALNRGAI